VGARRSCRRDAASPFFHIAYRIAYRITYRVARRDAASRVEVIRAWRKEAAEFGGRPTARLRAAIFSLAPIRERTLRRRRLSTGWNLSAVPRTAGKPENHLNRQDLFKPTGDAP
jgi:hypothetical protein